MIRRRYAGAACLFALVLTLVTISRCDFRGGEADAPPRAATPGAVAEKPARATVVPGSVSEFKEFDPQVDREATELLRRLIETKSSDVRSQLAAHYESRGYRGMAAFVRASAEAAKGHGAQQWLSSITEASPPSGTMWACNDFDSIAVDEVVWDLARMVGDDKFNEARTAGHAAMARLGRPCPVALETALASLGAAAWGEELPAEELELAFRTLLTADLEMAMPPLQGGRPWPYQIAAIVFLPKDAPSAAVAAEIALLHSRQEPTSEAAQQVIRDLAARTWRAVAAGPPA